MVDYREILRLQSLGHNITQIAGSLRSDILENLGHRHYGSPAYQLFKELQYNGGDPMEFRDYLVKVQKPVKANGHVGTNLSLKRKPFWGMSKSFEYSTHLVRSFRGFGAGHPEIRCSDSGCQCSPL